MIEDIVNSILSQLGAGSKEIIYISVTPNVGLEMIQIDPGIKAVKTYGYRPLAYNDSMREIANYDDFRIALKELFEELNINPKCNIVMSLPSVHIGKINLPLLLNDEAISEAIVSEVEQAYIFKRCEPVVSWFEAYSPNTQSGEMRTIFYSAIQKTVVDQIKDILSEIGATLSSLEISLTSTFRAMAFAGLTDVQMTNNTIWNLMIINNNGYSVISMSGKNIVDYYEEPLALKTYDMAEIYEIINSSAQIALLNFPANYLYIVSNTDMVSAEHLASKLQVDGTITSLENNAYRKKEFLPVSLNILPDKVLKISLEAVGIGTIKLENLPFKLDFSGNKNDESSSSTDNSIYFDFKGKEIMLTEAALTKITLVICVILLLPLVLIMFLMPQIVSAEKSKLDGVNNNIQAIETKINQLSSETSTQGDFVVNIEVEKVLKANREKLITYSALSQAIPKDLWLTYLSIDAGQKIDIQGISEDVENVYLFYRNLKSSMINSNLRLIKLENLSSAVDEIIIAPGAVLYEFQISNSNSVKPAVQANPVTPPVTKKDTTQVTPPMQNPMSEDAKNLTN